MSDIQAVKDEFNLLDDEVPENNRGTIYIDIEEDGEDTAISFGHSNLSRIEVVNLLSYVLDQYVAELGICICGECDLDDEDDE